MHAAITVNTVSDTLNDDETKETAFSIATIILCESKTSVEMKYIDRKKYKINVTINVFIFGANYIYFTVAFFNIIKKIIVVTTCMVIVVNIIITFTTKMVF